MLGQLAIGVQSRPPPLLARAPARHGALDSRTPAAQVRGPEFPETEPMPERTIAAQPLTAEAFAPFGDVIEAAGPSYPINAGMCDRFHDRARMEFTGDGRAGIGRTRLGTARRWRTAS